MPVSKEFVAYVVEQLAPLAQVTSRRMFGGVGLYANELFFGLIAQQTLYFKVDDGNRADYERIGSQPFRPFPDKQKFSMSYYAIPADLLEDADALSQWARKSVAAALAARKPAKVATKKKSSRNRSSRRRV